MAVQTLSGTRLAEVLRTHFSLQAPAAPRSDPAPALQSATPALRAKEPAPALLTAGAAAPAVVRADEAGQRGERGASGRYAMEAPATVRTGVSWRPDARGVPVQRHAGAPCAGRHLGGGAQYPDPNHGHLAASQQRTQRAPAHRLPPADVAGRADSLSKGFGVQGAGVCPAGRARTPLRPLPQDEQVPDPGARSAGAHEPAWEAGEASKHHLSSDADRGLAWEGAAAAAAAAPAGQLASDWEHRKRARAASEPAANAAAARTGNARMRAVEAEARSVRADLEPAWAAGAPAGVPAQGAPIRGALAAGRRSRPLYAHLSLDRLRGSDPGSRPGPDPEDTAAACGVHSGSLDSREPVARELLGIRPRRAHAERLQSSSQAAQQHGHQVRTAVSGCENGAGGAGAGFGLGPS